MGSIERFIAILIENFEGDFPLWIAPVQARVLPVSEKHESYAKEVFEQLKDKGVRVELEERNETLGKKIRFAETDKIPYILIVGDKEVESRSVSVRRRKEGDLGCMSIDDFVLRLQKEVDSRR